MTYHSYLAQQYISCALYEVRVLKFDILYNRTQKKVEGSIKKNLFMISVKFYEVSFINLIYNI